MLYFLRANAARTTQVARAGIESPVSGAPSVGRPARGSIPDPAAKVTLPDGKPLSGRGNRTLPGVETVHLREIMSNIVPNGAPDTVGRQKRTRRSKMLQRVKNAINSLMTGLPGNLQWFNFRMDSVAFVVAFWIPVCRSRPAVSASTSDFGICIQRNHRISFSA